MQGSGKGSALVPAPLLDHNTLHSAQEELERCLERTPGTEIGLFFERYLKTCREADDVSFVTELCGNRAVWPLAV